MTEERAVERRLRAAVESAPSGLLMVDATGSIVLVNREIERLFGYERSELLGRSIELLVPERIQDGHGEDREAFMRHPTRRPMGAGRDLFGLRKDGSEVPVEIGLTPVQTDEGTFVLGSVVDISTRKEAEAERRRLEEQLRRSQRLEALGTLAGGVAHDFNNILGAIIGYAELLQLEAADKTREDVAELLAAAKRGRRLVERILAFSRRQEAVRRPTALGDVAEETRGMLRATLPSAVEIRLVVADQLPRVRADATAVQQVIMNLAMNAADAMSHRGTMEILIEPNYLRDSEARARPDLREGTHVLLSVRDSGPGMAPEVVRRAFEPFFTTKPPGSGSGLGLATVHGLMSEHDGRVEIESAVGSGTTVRCWFPVVDADIEPGPLLSSVPRGRGEHVLFVDDEGSLARVGERLLLKLGYRVTTTTDPREALERFRADPEAFDLVVSDLTMPHISGVHLARAIKETRAVPILLLTGHAEGLDADALTEAGISEVLLKPVTIAELAAGVARLMA